MKALKTFGLVVIVLGAFMALGLATSLYSAKSVTTACATTATLVGGSLDGYANIICDNNSNNSIYLGGSDVAQSGYCISKDTTKCPLRYIQGDYARGALYCRTDLADAGSQAINCLTGK